MKRNLYFFISLLICAITFSFPLIAQDEKKDDWKFSASVQMRSEMDGRDFMNTTHPYTYTSLRTRFGVEKTLFDRYTIFAQIQDGRQFGDDAGILAPQKNLSLQQGYILINNIFDQPLSFKGGRFEMRYGSGRFIQSSSWSHLPRAFDGAVITYKTDPFWIDVFGITNKFSKPLMTAGTADTNINPYNAVADSGSFLYGFWGNAKINKNNKIDLFTYYEYYAKKSDKLNKDLDRFTSGLNYELTIGSFSVNVEFAYQYGTMNAVTGKDVKYFWVWKVDSLFTGAVKDSAFVNHYTNIDLSSWLGFIGLKYKLPDYTLSLNADMLSGSDKDKYHAYYNDYASKHTFMGYMDYFTNLEKGTAGKGVNDYFFRFEYLPKGSLFNAQLDAHYFMTNVPYLMPDKSESSALGQEIDITLKYNFIKNSLLEWGGAVFLPGEVTKDIYKVKKNNITYMREDPSFWTYLMLRLAL